MQKEKDDMKKQMQQDQEYIKKLEAKVSINLKEIGFNKIEAKVAKLKEKSETQEKTIVQLENVVKQQQNEIAVLSQALEMQSQGTGVQASLLYDVSRLQRENAQFNEELSSKLNQITSMQQEMQQLQQHMDEICYARDSATQELMQKQQDAETLEQELMAIKMENQDLQAERHELVSLVEEKNKDVAMLREERDAKSKLEEESQKHTTELSSQFQINSAELHNLRERYDQLYQTYVENESKLQEELFKVQELEHKLSKLEQSERKAIVESEHLRDQLDQFARLTSDAETEKETLTIDKESLEQTVDQFNDKVCRFARVYIRLYNYRNKYKH